MKGVWLAFAALLQLSNCYYYNRGSNSVSYSRFQTLENRVENLEGKVEVLTNELLADAERVACIKYEDIPREIPVDFPKILPLVARKELMPGDQLRLSLQFWTSVPLDQLTILWQNHEAFFEKINRGRTAHAVDPSKPGQAEVSLTVLPGNTSSMSVMIQAETNFHTYFFNTTTSNSENQSCIPLPMLQKEVPGDIVYQPGHDVKIVLTVPPEFEYRDGTPDQYYTNLDVIPYLIDLATGGVFERIEDNNLTQEYTSRDLLTSQEVTAVLDTSTNYVSGYLRLEVEDGVRQGMLVSRVKRAEEIVLRPSSQTGAFPPGYVVFLVQPYTHMAPDGSQTMGCDRNSMFPTCYAGCAAMGTGLTELNIYQLDTETGTPTLVTAFEEEQALQHAYKAAWFNVEDTPSHMQIIQCIAFNDAGNNATRDIYVFFYDSVRINKNDTGYSLLNETTALVTCVADGSQHINVTIDIGNGFEPADDVTEEEDRVVVTKVVEVDFRYGNYYNFVCQATQVLPTGEEKTDSYLFSVRQEETPRPAENSSAIFNYIRHHYVNDDGI